MLTVDTLAMIPAKYFEMQLVLPIIIINHPAKRLRLRLRLRPEISLAA